MKKLLITVLVLAGLLLGVDRIGAYTAGRVLAGQIRTSAELETTPKVSIGGFPFLTQALSGRFDQIDVEAEDVHRSGVTLSSFDLRITGADVPLADALSGDVGSVPVEALDADMVVSYVDLASSSKIFGVKVVPKGDAVEVTGRVTVLGQTLTAKALSDVALSGNNLVVTARSVSVLGVQSPRINRAVAGLLDFTVRVDKLPYGLKLERAAVGPSGVVLKASSGPTVLTRR